MSTYHTSSAPAPPVCAGRPAFFCTASSPCQKHSSSASISAALTAAAALLQASPGRMVVFRISDGNTHAVRSTAHTKQPPSHGCSRRSARKPSSSSTVPMAGRR